MFTIGVPALARRFLTSSQICPVVFPATFAEKMTSCSAGVRCGAMAFCKGVIGGRDCSVEDDGLQMALWGTQINHVYKLVHSGVCEKRADLLSSAARPPLTP